MSTWATTGADRRRRVAFSQQAPQLDHLARDYLLHLFGAYIDEYAGKPKFQTDLPAYVDAWNVP